MKNGFKYDVDAIRAQFPACKLEIAGAPIAYLDGPGGTQVPQPVLDAMVGYMVNDNANEDGNFRASTMARYTEETARAPRRTSWAARSRRWASAWPPPRIASTWP